MKISADFDSGNIQVIDASDPQRVLLAMRPDHTLARVRHLDWPEVAREALIGYLPGNPVRRLLEDHLEATRSGQQSPPTIVCDSADAVLELAIKGLGMAWLPHSLAASAVRAGLLKVLGGHDHDPISVHEGGTLILKAGYDAHYLGVVDLTVRTATGAPATATAATTITVEAASATRTATAVAEVKDLWGRCRSNWAS